MLYDRLDSYNRKLKFEYIPWLQKLSERWQEPGNKFDFLLGNVDARLLLNAQTLIGRETLVQSNIHHFIRVLTGLELDKAMPFVLEKFEDGTRDTIAQMDQYMIWISRAFAILDFAPGIPLLQRAPDFRTHPGHHSYAYKLPFDETLLESWDGYQRYLGLGGNAGQTIVVANSITHRKDPQAFDLFMLRFALAYEYGFAEAKLDPATMTFSWEEIIRISPYSAVNAHPCTRKDCSVESCTNQCVVCYSYYCSNECQKMDWKSHKPHCKRPILSQVNIKIHISAGNNVQICQNRETLKPQICTGDETEEFPYVQMEKV